MNSIRIIGASILAIAFAISSSGCASEAKSGSLMGAGIGALAGQAIGGSTQATLIGAAVGTGVGYMIGNEKDKEHAAQMSRNQPTKTVYVHTEVASLGGTRWNLVSLSPRDAAAPYVSKIIDFRPNGRVITTTTRENGTVDTYDESYRVVSNTLIVNKPGYVINARYELSGDQLIISADKFSAVLKRLR